MFEKIYPWVTFLLIFITLLLTLFVVGAIAGISNLIILTFCKVILAKIAAPVKNIVDKAGGAGKEAAQLAKGAKSMNIWALIIDYLFTPMNQAEQISLIIGWVLWPIALAGGLAFFFGGLAGIMCQPTLVIALPFDWCKLIKPIVDIFK